MIERRGKTRAIKHRGAAYRVAAMLSDGRRIYYSKRGKLNLMSRKDATLMEYLYQKNPDRAYSWDLAWYGPIQFMIDSFMFYHRVVGVVSERADLPFPEKSYIIGGERADSVPSFDDRKESP